MMDVEQGRGVKPGASLCPQSAWRVSRLGEADSPKGNLLPDDKRALEHTAIRRES
jgi:hypothetical protein